MPMATKQTTHEAMVLWTVLLVGSLLVRLGGLYFAYAIGSWGGVGIYSLVTLITEGEDRVEATFLVKRAHYHHGHTHY